MNKKKTLQTPEPIETRPQSEHQPEPERQPQRIGKPEPSNPYTYPIEIDGIGIVYPNNDGT